MYTYIDDTINSLLDKKEIKRAKQELSKRYNMKTMKEINHILGIKIKRLTEDI